MPNVTSETLDFVLYSQKTDAINGFMDAIYDKIKDIEDNKYRKSMNQKLKSGTSDNNHRFNNNPSNKIHGFV